MRTLLFTLFIVLTSSLFGQADYKANFLKKWENAAQYTIEVAEAMPAEFYDFRPHPESRTFQEQLLHTVDNMMWLSNSYMDGTKYERSKKAKSFTKEEMLGLLETGFHQSTMAVKAFPSERLGEVVEFFAGPMERQQILMLMTDHMTHHRGQILVYLKIKEVKAPQYRGW